MSIKEYTVRSLDEIIASHINMVGLFVKDPALIRRLRGKYTSSKAIPDDEETNHVYLDVGNQHFRVTCDDGTETENALWFRTMLAIALATVVDDEGNK